MDTNTTSAQPGGAQGSREEFIMGEGIRAGYFLALSHLEEALEKRFKSQEEIAERFARSGMMTSRAIVMARRQEALSLLDRIDAHRERITKFFDFSEGGIL